MNYYCLESFPVLNASYINEALTAEYKLHNSGAYTDIRAKTSFDESAFMSLLRESLGDVTCMWAKYRPMSILDWHTDPGRKCSINIPVTSHPAAKTLYRKRYGGALYDVEEVKYILGKPTVMDVTKPHCVFNVCPEERIVLSISPIKAQFLQTIEFLKNLHIESY
jgi:hypothetical protein